MFWGAEGQRPLFSQGIVVLHTHFVVYYYRRNLFIVKPYYTGPYRFSSSTPASTDLIVFRNVNCSSHVPWIRQCSNDKPHHRSKSYGNPLVTCCVCCRRPHPTPPADRTSRVSGCIKLHAEPRQCAPTSLRFIAPPLHLLSFTFLK